MNVTMKRTQPEPVLKLASKRKDILFSFFSGLKLRATKVRPVCCYFFYLVINYLAIFLQCGVAPVGIDATVKPSLLLKIVQDVTRRCYLLSYESLWRGKDCFGSHKITGATCCDEASLPRAKLITNISIITSMTIENRAL